MAVIHCERSIGKRNFEGGHREQYHNLESPCRVNFFTFLPEMGIFVESHSPYFLLTQMLGFQIKPIIAGTYR